MAQITLTATNFCDGGTHADLTVTGDASYASHWTLEDIRDTITDDEKLAFLKVLIRIGAIGRTNQQVRNALTAGWTINI